MPESLEPGTNLWNIETWLLHDKYLPNPMQTSFMANHKPEQYRFWETDFQILKLTQYKATVIELN